MAVSVTQDAIFQPMQTPPQNLALPVARWIAATSVSGDATGGTVSLTGVITRKGGYNLFSVEAVNSHRQDAGAADVTVMYALSLWADQDLTTGGPWIWGTRTLRPTNIGRTIPQGSDVGQWPFPFRGVKDVNILIAAEWDINTNLAVYRFFAWGYVWDVATLKFGGPRRP